MDKWMDGCCMDGALELCIVFIKRVQYLFYTARGNIYGVVY